MRKCWPLVLTVAGVLLVPLGFAMAVSGAGRIGVVLCCLGLVVFLIGSVTGIVRFAIRRRVVPHFLCGLAAVVLVVFAVHRYCFSLAYVRGAQEHPYDLWMAALKPLYLLNCPAWQT